MFTKGPRAKNKRNPLSSDNLIVGALMRLMTVSDVRPVMSDVGE